MVNSCKVSVIMPCFNPQKDWVIEAVQSIINQTYTNWELIIVNDGTDIPLKFSEIKDMDERIKIIFHDKNYNQATALNTGVAESKGKFITFIDTDDKWHKDKLQIQLNYFDEFKEIDIVYTDGYYIDENSRVIREMNLCDCNNNIFEFNPISVGSVMIKKKVLDKVNCFDENLNRSQDWDMWIQIYKEGYVIEHIIENLFYYREHPKQKSKVVSQKEAHDYIKKKHNLK